MIKKIAVLLFLFPTTCFAQLENFTGEFRGLEGTITYTATDENHQPLFDENDKLIVITEECKNLIGRYSRTADSFKISVSLTNPDADVDDIPTECLAREHWWTSFELLMKAQREYAECVGAVKEHQLRLGDTCFIDDPTCHPIGFLVTIIKEYWVPHSIVVYNNFGDVKLDRPPRRKDWLNHFEAGISGIDTAINNRDACRSYLEFLRTIP